jgi:ketosteroid isomerase-like protein
MRKNVHAQESSGGSASQRKVDMSHESELQAIYGALNAKNVDEIANTLTEGVIFHILPNPVLPATTLTGREAILTFMREQLDAIDLKQEIEQISVNGDFATAYVVSTSTGSDGEQQTVRWADLFQFDGDRICQHVSLAG